MSDDFLAEISAAVDGGNTTLTPSEIVSDLAPTQEKPAEITKVVDAQKEAEEFINKISDDAPKPKRETLTPKKKEQTTDKTDETKQKTEEKTDDKKKAPVSYLDRFLKDDGKGNLVLADGTIVALAGPSRTYVEALKKEGRQARDEAHAASIKLVQIGDQFKKLHSEFQQMKNSKHNHIDTLATETGMSSTEIADAIQLMRQYKADPLTAIKSLLTQAHARGINVSSLGANAGAVDIPTLVRMMKDQPKVEEKPKAPSQEDLLRQAEEEAASFLKRYPAAEEHSDMIAAVKAQRPQMSLDEIWLHVQAWLRRQAEMLEQQEATTAKNTSVVNSKPRIAPKPATQQPDYSRMTFQEIAQTLHEEL